MDEEREDKIRALTSEIEALKKSANNYNGPDRFKKLLNTVEESIEACGIYKRENAALRLKIRELEGEDGEATDNDSGSSTPAEQEQCKRCVEIRAEEEEKLNWRVSVLNSELSGLYIKIKCDSIKLPKIREDWYDVISADKEKMIELKSERYRVEQDLKSLYLIDCEDCHARLHKKI